MTDASARLRPKVSISAVTILGRVLNFSITRACATRLSTATGRLCSTLSHSRPGHPARPANRPMSAEESPTARTAREQPSAHGFFGVPLCWVSNCPRYYPRGRRPRSTSHKPPKRPRFAARRPVPICTRRQIGFCGRLLRIHAHFDSARLRCPIQRRNGAPARLQAEGRRRGSRFTRRGRGHAADPAR